jgi:hypothetical protein
VATGAQSCSTLRGMAEKETEHSNCCLTVQQTSVREASPCSGTLPRHHSLLRAALFGFEPAWKGGTFLHAKQGSQFKVNLASLDGAPRFWDFYKVSGPPFWGFGLFRYLSDDVAKNLRDAVIAAAKKGRSVSAVGSSGLVHLRQTTKTICLLSGQYSVTGIA